MKFRESGMPNEGQWSTYFEPKQVLEKLGINGEIKTLVDVGCGYGTFLFPAAELIKSKTIGIDIDEAMIEVCRRKEDEFNVANIDFIRGDISKDETLNELKALADAIDCVLLFNILHCEGPEKLLRTVYNSLGAGGKAGGYSLDIWRNAERPVHGYTADSGSHYKLGEGSRL